MPGVRQLDLLDAAAELLDLLERARAPLGHARLDPLLLDAPDAEAQAVEALGARQRRSPSGMPSEVESHGSRPSMWRSRSAASVTSRVSGPHWSSDEAKAIIP